MRIGQIWPSIDSKSRLDKALLRLGLIPGRCNICGSFTVFLIRNDMFREGVSCAACASVNRQRQMAAVLLSQVLGTRNRVPWLASISNITESTVVWNAEATRALHKKLQHHLGANYISSEYLSPDLQSGDIIDNTLHVDIQATHFKDNSIDYILTSDVLEHVPFPLRAIKETYRILKPGGCHIFTVPFYKHRFSNETRAIVNAQGEVEHLHKPWYHEDPMSDDGVLVYTVFAPELLCQLEACGFDATLQILRSPVHGILGENGLVIVAKKSHEPVFKLDWIFGND